MVQQRRIDRVLGRVACRYRAWLKAPPAFVVWRIFHAQYIVTRPLVSVAVAFLPVYSGVE